MRKTHTSDLFDAKWVCLKVHLLLAKLPGRLRALSLRDVFDASSPCSSGTDASKDYERKVQTSETLVEVAAIRSILRRLASAA